VVVTDAVEIPVPDKVIVEYVGRVATGDERVSIAHMRSPERWTEPGQTPEFDEYTIVLSGTLLVHHDGGTAEVKGGQAVNVPAGTAVRYETPDGAEYVSVCVPAFSPDLAHREPE
jgi:ethanolamine utilization protein EutQ (cupin superfamily)